MNSEAEQTCRWGWNGVLLNDGTIFKGFQNFSHFVFDFNGIYVLKYILEYIYSFPTIGLRMA